MKRGLTDLLELHLRDFPPADEIEGRLMMREIKLAESADKTRGRVERQAARAEANRILQSLIDDHPDDPRRFDWRYELAHGLLYDEAEEHISSILYRGGTKEDRVQLALRSSRAVDALQTLVAALENEFDRIDRLPVAEFERLQSAGYVEKLDRLGPRAEYLLLWARFYHLLTLDDADPERIQQLHEVAGRIVGKPAWRETPHTISGVQVPALLLSGMVHRRLQQYAQARADLAKALAVAEALDDPDEADRLRWALNLAHIEHIRTDCDDGRFDQGIHAVQQFRKSLAAAPQEVFGLEVVAALEERSIYRRRAARAEAAGRPEHARRDRQRAWMSVLRAARHRPDRVDELYATLYEMIRRPIDEQTREAFEALDPVERSALLAGLLAEWQAHARDTDSARRILLRAVDVGEWFLSGWADEFAVPAGRQGEAGHVPPGSHGVLRAEVLFNLGVARYRLGEVVPAAKAFLRVVREHPDFRQAQEAARLAVQLSAQRYEDPSHRNRNGVTGLHREALETLLHAFPDSDAARYWRFYFAQLLHETGEYDAAAAEYARVDATHRHHLHAMFQRVQSLAAVLSRTYPAPIGHRTSAIPLRRIGAGRPNDSPHAVERSVVPEKAAVLDALFDALRDFQTEAARRLGQAEQQNDGAAGGTGQFRHMLALARVLSAEHQIPPYRDTPAAALETLRGFEDVFCRQATPAGRRPVDATDEETPGCTSALRSRIWRVRVLAYQALGQVEQARRATAAYLRVDPVGGSRTLQALYLHLWTQVEGSGGDTPRKDDGKTRQMALMLAEQLVELGAWTGRKAGPTGSPGPTGLPERAALPDDMPPALLWVQLAEARLAAGLPEEAAELFEPLCRDVASPPVPRRAGPARSPSIMPGPGGMDEETKLHLRARACLGHAQVLLLQDQFADALPHFNKLTTTLPAHDPLRWQALLGDLRCRTELSHPPEGIIKVIRQQRQLHPTLGGPDLARQFERLLRENERRRDHGS